MSTHLMITGCLADKKVPFFFWQGTVALALKGFSDANVVLRVYKPHKYHNYCNFLSEISCTLVFLDTSAVTKACWENSPL